MLIRWQKTIVDQRGNVQPGAVLTIRRESDQALVKIYRDREGNEPYPTGTVTADENGYAHFYAAPGLYRITSIQPSIDWRDVPIGQAADETLRAQLADATTPNAGAAMVGYMGPGEAQATLADFAVAGSGGAALVAFKQPDAEAVDRILQEKLAETASLMDFGAVGDGATSDDAAFAAALAARDDVYLPAGEFVVSSSLTVPNGKRIFLGDGAKIKVIEGETLTFRGLLIGGARQVFTGDGSVLGIKDVRPEWWGAQRNGAAHDDADAFNKAQACLEASATSDGQDTVMRLSGGSYGIGSTVTITPRNGMKIQWWGQGGADGTVLLGLAEFEGASVLRVAGAASNSSISSLYVKSFRIIPQTAGAGALIGVSIGGSPTYTLQGGPHESSVIEDVGVYEFKTGWYLENVRLYSFNRIGAWTNTITPSSALTIKSVSETFTGDLDFHCCQFVAPGSNSRSLEISTTAGGDISGIRFHASIFYSGSMIIGGAGASRLCDIWFCSGWQFDVPVADGVLIAADGAGCKVYNINFLDGYFAGGQAGTFKAINAFAVNGGHIRSIKVSRMRFLQGTGDCVFFNGSVSDVSVTDNSFLDQSGGACIVLGSGVSNAVVTGNIAERLNSAFFFDSVVRTVPGANRYVIRNNSGGGYAVTVIDDAAAAPIKVVDGNI